MTIDSSAITSVFKKYPVLFASVFLSLAFALAIYFRGNLRTEQQEELDKYRAEAIVYRTNIANSFQLQQQLDYLIQANSALAQRGFRPDSLALNLQYFYRLESEIGFKYLNLNPTGRSSTPGGKAAPKSAYTPINYSISVQGTFPQIIIFLKNLEQGAYFARVNSASMSYGGSNVTLNLDVDLFGVQ